MRFNFFLKNHHVSGVASLEDIIRPIAAGLLEGGHSVQFEYNQLYPRPWINIIFEYFPSPDLVESIRIEKERLGDQLILGMIGTEDLADTISMGAKGEQKRLYALKDAFSLFDFIWTIVPPDEYNMLLDGRRTAHFLPLGHCPSLVGGPSSDQTIDVVLYGKLNRWRAPVVHRIVKAGSNVQATFGDMPEYLRFNMIQRAKLVLDMRRGDVVRYLSPSRICASLHNGSIVVSENFDTTSLSTYYRYAVPAAYDELADTCLNLISDDEGRLAKAAELRTRFAEETSMRRTMEALIATLPS